MLNSKPQTLRVWQGPPDPQAQEGFLAPGYDTIMETYLPTLTVAGVLGFLAPLLSTAISKLTWSSQIKQLVALAVAVFMAVVSLLVTAGFRPLRDGENPAVYWITTLLAVVAVAQLAYQLVYKNPSLGSVNDKVALATSTETERQKFIAANTIQGEVIPEGKESVPDSIVENTITVDGSIQTAHLRPLDGDSPYTR